MELGALRKITALAAADVAKGFELSPEGAALLRPGLTPALFLEALADASQWIDAIRFLAFAMPRREGVWWACLAARTVTAPGAAGGIAAIAAAEQWVYDQTDEARRAAFAAAEPIGFTTPAAYAALGAYWSGGSLAPPGMPDVPPAPALSPTAIASAILLAAVIGEPQKAAAKYRSFLTTGIDIANGGNGRGNKAV